MEDTQTDLTRDALRLLYVLGQYSRHPDGGVRRWMRMDSLYVIALLGVKSGAFTGYDLAPALFQYRGVKMFAMLSHEAGEDVNFFFNHKLVERILLNTWFYATLTGVRITDTGIALLRERLTDEDRQTVKDIIRCKACGGLTDFAASVEEDPDVHLVMCRVCECQTGGRHKQGDDWLKTCRSAVTRIDDFFGIGEVEYVASPFFFGDANGQ